MHNQITGINAKRQCIVNQSIWISWQHAAGNNTLTMSWPPTRISTTLCSTTLWRSNTSQVWVRSGCSLTTASMYPVGPRFTMVLMVFFSSALSFRRESSIWRDGPGMIGDWVDLGLTLPDPVPAPLGRLVLAWLLSFFSKLEHRFSKRTTAISKRLLLSCKLSQASVFSCSSRANSFTPRRRMVNCEFSLLRRWHSSRICSMVSCTSPLTVEELSSCESRLSWGDFDSGLCRVTSAIFWCVPNPTSRSAPRRPACSGRRAKYQADGSWLME